MTLQVTWFENWLTGFFLTKQAGGCSKDTVIDYQRTFRHFTRWCEASHKTSIDEITTTSIREFLLYLRGRPNNRGGTLSSKSIYNSWAALRSFWDWYSQETGKENVTKAIPPPKVAERVISPLTKDEISRMLKACEFSSNSFGPNHKEFRVRQKNALRDKAMLLFFLDTGLRVSELIRLTIGDINMVSGEVTVKLGKGSKSRVVYAGKGARKLLWKYLQFRENPPATDLLFVTQEGHVFNREHLARLFKGIGTRAGVGRMHPHRLRHTFATEFLRNGGNLFGLQRLLGHAQLDQVKRYAEIVNADLARAHESGSPVDRWHL